MKVLIRAIVVLIALAVLLLAAGLLLPSQFKVQRSVEIGAPASKVYPLIAAPAAWSKWSVWNQRDPNMKLEYSGATSGAGARWSWQSVSEGNGAMEFIEAVPDQKVAYQLSFPDLGMQSRGLLTIDPAGNGVRVTWTNEGDMGANPVNRWFGLFMDRLVGPDFEAGLTNLKKLAEAG
jgi:uncharacterized protein YndB with AHSA1/START domain